MSARVVNLREFRYPRERGGFNLPPDVVRIDRSSRWGNPYVIGQALDVRAPEGGSILTASATRDQVITAFDWYAEARLRVEPHWLDPLEGKRLACWCAPLSCHGDMLAMLIP